jgi:hypothetical protein
MLHCYKGEDQRQAHFVLLKWGAAVLRPYVRGAALLH